MPPKPRYTREEIINAAYELTREIGIDAIAARAVGRRLGSTPTPIFSFFGSMEELKNEVIEKAKRECIAYLEESMSYSPTYKEFGLRWVRYALKEPELYKLLFTDSDSYIDSTEQALQYYNEITDPMCQSIEQDFCLDRTDAKILLNHMIIHANGIAVFAILRRRDYTDEYIVRILSETCIGIVTTIKLNNGSFDTELVGKLAQNVCDLPVRID